MELRMGGGNQVDQTSQEKRLRVANLLRAVADGAVTAEAALQIAESWDDVPWATRAFGDAYHALQHFKIDKDIRDIDERYADDQIEGLRRFASRLDTR